MQSAEAQKYCVMMAEIKTRWRLVKIVGEGRVSGFPPAVRVEFVYLQFRKILELIAMGSLLANSRVLGQVQSKIQRYWNAKNLLKDIQAINPDFYPKPIVQKPSQRPGINVDWLDRSGGYLTKDRFVTLYDKCGSILHAHNPFARQQDYLVLEKEAPNWHLWIRNLLNVHTIRLIGDATVWLMQMGSDPEPPTYHSFVPSKPPKSDA
jgi:hypothetical protein